MTWSPEGGAIAFFQDNVMGAVPSKEDGVCDMEGGLCTGILVAISSTVLSEPQTTVFPHVTLVCSALPLSVFSVSVWE